MSEVRRKGATVRSGERELIRRVINCCDEEAANNNLLVPIKKATERVAKYCKVSQSFVKQIRRESRKRPNESLISPGKKRPKAEEYKADVDEFDRNAIKNIIDRFYTNNTVPTCATLLTVLKEEIGFKYSDWTLRRILKEMGFQWKKCISNRSVLIERQNIVNWRYKYLRQVKKLREEGRELFFLDETWIDTNLYFRCCWQSEKVTGIIANNSATNRLIVVHIGSRNGFLHGAGLVFRAGTATGDYHGQMNGENFEKWLTNKVIPNLPPASVVIMDNAPYHSKELDRAPSSASLKVEIISWLNKHGVVCDQTWLKGALLEKVESIKPKEKVFRADKLFQRAGHIVLRTPPYMCELNPIELAWARLKRIVRSRNTKGNMSLKFLQEEVDKALDSITPNEWASFCRHVEKLEKEYWEKDGIMENTIEDIVISLGGYGSGSEDEDLEEAFSSADDL